MPLIHNRACWRSLRVQGTNQAATVSKTNVRVHASRFVVSHMHFLFGCVVVLGVDIRAKTAHQTAFEPSLAVLVFIEGEVRLPEGGGHHTLGPAHVLSHSHTHRVTHTHKSMHWLSIKTIMQCLATTIMIGLVRMSGSRGGKGGLRT